MAEASENGAAAPPNEDQPIAPAAQEELDALTFDLNELMLKDE